MPAGRKPAHVEYVNLLKDLLGFEKNSTFARAAGVRASNATAYLKGSKVPQKRVLRSMTTRLFSRPVAPILEVEPLPASLTNLSNESGVYILYDSAGNVLYVGKAKKFRAELTQTLNRSIPVPIRLGGTMRKKKPKFKELVHHVSFYAVPDSHLRHNLEALLLRVFANQTHNSNIGKFK